MIRTREGGLLYEPCQLATQTTKLSEASLYRPVILQHPRSGSSKPVTMKVPKEGEEGEELAPPDPLTSMVGANSSRWSAVMVISAESLDER